MRCYCQNPWGKDQEEFDIETGTGNGTILALHLYGRLSLGPWGGLFASLDSRGHGIDG